MGIDPLAAYASYSAAWKAANADQAARLLADCWATDGSLFDPETPGGVIGRDALAEYIAATHAEMPGLEVSELSAPELLGGRMRVAWSAYQAGEAKFTGIDFIEFSSDGRISQVTMFYDSTPD